MFVAVAPAVAARMDSTSSNPDQHFAPSVEETLVAAVTDETTEKRRLTEPARVRPTLVAHFERAF